jgi:hypothetical protein
VGSPERGRAPYPGFGFAVAPGWRILPAVQKLFSMFPLGLPGLALLLLRASVALALLLQCYVERQALSGWIQAAATAIAAALCVGYLTPIAAASALLLHGSIWFGAGIDGAAWAIIVAFNGIALALLGPGAYSLDSRLFGRRLVVLPPQ